MMKNSIAIAAIVLASGNAIAGFEADWVTLQGLNDSIRIDNTGFGGVLNDTFNAGHFIFEYTDVGGDRGIGQFAGGTFATFCIELQGIANGSQSYEIDSIRNAPDPSPGLGGAYDSADEAEVNAVVAAAIRLGWINSDLSLNAASNHQLAAIQGMIWKVVLDEAVVTGENATVASHMATLQAEIDLDPNATVDHLRAMVSADSQDQLYIVPLPTAAFAGLITLAGIGGYKRIRRA